MASTVGEARRALLLAGLFHVALLYPLPARSRIVIGDVRLAAERAAETVVMFQEDRTLDNASREYFEFAKSYEAA